MSSTIFTAQKVIDGSVRKGGGGAQKKGWGENSLISPPQDPRLLVVYCFYIIIQKTRDFSMGFTINHN